MTLNTNKLLLSTTKTIYISLIITLFQGCAHNTDKAASRTAEPLPETTVSQNEVVAPDAMHQAVTEPVETSQSNALESTTTELAPLSFTSAWDRLRHSRIIDTRSHSDAVQRELNYFLQEPEMVDRFTQRAGPYLGYVLDALEREGLPLELAVLPFIESAYNPAATSRKGAAGLWQLMLGTAHELKVKQTIWYDGRRDLIESTDAALDYLNFLSQKFDQDWLLTLAAYNAGHNRVTRLIDKNKGNNKASSFWDLSLPRETRTYVPRYLAFLELIRNADQHSIQLPDISNDLSYHKVATSRPVDIPSLEKKLGLVKGTLTSLNNGYIREVTPPGKEWYLLVPQTVDSEVPALLASMPSPDLSQHTLTHRIQRGETLSHISKRYGVRISHIQRVNNLSGTRIRAGKRLTIPAPIIAFENEPQTNDGQHVVRRGETLWEIARKYHLSLADLTLINHMNAKDLIKPGEILIIR